METVRFFRRFFKAENDEKTKTRQNAENKQTFELQFAFDRIREKFKLGGKTCQNAESKQTFDLTGKIEIEGKTRQNAENKQTFGIFHIIVAKYSVFFKHCDSYCFKTKINKGDYVCPLHTVLWSNRRPIKLKKGS